MKPGDVCLLKENNTLCIILEQVPHPYGFKHVKMFLVLLADGDQVKVSQPLLQLIEVTCNR